MFSYRERQLNIDEKLKEDYERTTDTYLTSYDIDRWIKIDFGLDPETEHEKFTLLNDEQIVWCAEENMKEKSF